MLNVIHFWKNIAFYDAVCLILKDFISVSITPNTIAPCWHRHFTWLYLTSMLPVSLTQDGLLKAWGGRRQRLRLCRVRRWSHRHECPCSGKQAQSQGTVSRRGEAFLYMYFVFSLMVERWLCPIAKWKFSSFPQVELKSGATFDAKIKDVDEKADIALIKIDTPVKFLFFYCILYLSIQTRQTFCHTDMIQSQFFMASCLLVMWGARTDVHHIVPLSKPTRRREKSMFGNLLIVEC